MTGTPELVTPAIPHWRRRLAQAWVTAADGFRLYRGTALLLAVGAIALVAALIPTGEAIARLRYHSVRGGGLGFTWASEVRSVADLQDQTLLFFSRLLLTTGIAITVVGALSVLTLCFARASSREGEMAVRRAVGASRRSLLATSLLEGTVTTLVALLLGGAGGALISRVALLEWPGALLPASGTGQLLIAAGVAALLLLGALLPTLLARRERIVEAEATPTALFFPATLQLGLSLIALTAGSLLLRQIELTRAEHPSAEAAGAVWSIDPPAMNMATRAAAYAALLDRVSGPDHLASLTSPGVTLGLGPVSRLITRCGLCSEGGMPMLFKHPLATHQFVSPDTFGTLGLAVLAGRVFTPKDDWQAPRVVVVSKALADVNFENGDAVGRTLTLGDSRDDWYTVIGVVEDRRSTAFGAGEQPPFTVYASVLQHPPSVVDLHLPTPGRSDSTAVQRAIVTTLPGTPAPAPLALATMWSAESAPVAWFGRWLGAGGWAMLLLASFGIFSFVRLWVLSLQPELGLRRATGATRAQVFALVLRRAGKVGLAGIALGLWFGPSLWIGLGETLPGAPAWDTALLLRYGLILLSTMLLGAAQPAWAATRATPHTLLSSTGE